MKLAYLVLTHKNPRLLQRTIRALSSEDCAFFVHVDLRSHIADFLESGARMFFSLKKDSQSIGGSFRVSCHALADAQAYEAPEGYDYFVHLSGSDYPLRSRNYIHWYFEANRGSEFITLIKMPAPGKPLSRITTIRSSRTSLYGDFSTGQRLS